MKAYIDLVIGSDELRPFGDLPYIRINKHVFSAGEVHMSIKDLSDLEGIEEVIILCHGRTHNVMEVLQIKDILDRNGIDKVTLYMPYFYYSRQDRATTPESSFALKIFCDLLETANFDRITTHDLHSGAAEVLLPNLSDRAPTELLDYVWDNNDYDYIIAPDAGATEKIYGFAEYLQIDKDKVITATKHRDPATGQLGSPSMDYRDILKLMNKKAVIFDDICDGGYTFIQLAKFLHGEVKVELDLAVTHGIFSKGATSLLNEFGTIYTTDSMRKTPGTTQIQQRKGNK